MFNDLYNINIEANISKWDKRSRNYEKGVFGYFRIIQKQVLDLIDFKPNTNFLDIGCATGWAVEYAAAKIKGKGMSIGIDISKQMIEKAIIISRFNNTYYKISDAHKMDFKKNYFDYILCTNSFHHYIYPNIVLKEIHRILKPNGRFYFLDPCTDNLIVRKINSWLQKKEKAHVSFYSTKEISLLFNKAKLLHQVKKAKFKILKLHVGEKKESNRSI